MTNEEWEAPLDAETETMIEEALERAKHEPAPVTARSVRFDPALHVLLVVLSTGRRLLIPQEDLQHLANASAEDAAEVTIEMLGTGLYWEKLDLDFSIDGLLEGRRGDALWMKDLHKRWYGNAGHLQMASYALAAILTWALRTSFAV